MIKDISNGLSSEGYDPLVYSSRGERLEELLTIVCEALGEAGSLTENKADLEFAVGVVGSYLISKKIGKLPEDAIPPGVLFEERLFPMIDNYTLEEEAIDVEVEEDGQ